MGGPTEKAIVPSGARNKAVVTIPQPAHGAEAAPAQQRMSVRPGMTPKELHEALSDITPIEEQVEEFFRPLPGG